MGTPDFIAAWSEVWVAQAWDWRLEWGRSCDLSPELRGLGLLQGSQCLNRTEFSNTQLGSRRLESWLLGGRKIHTWSQKCCEQTQFLQSGKQ